MQSYFSLFLKYLMLICSLIQEARQNQTKRKVWRRLVVRRKSPLLRLKSDNLKSMWSLMVPKHVTFDNVRTICVVSIYNQLDYRKL